ncbi:MAG: hypothetical protein M3Z96_06815 [Pseudomonadota bacterium]|nr:hypothetical protein [Pseudomonadota bacterium]
MPRIAFVLDPQGIAGDQDCIYSAVDSDLSSAFAWNKLIEDALEYMSPACSNAEWVIINETWYNPAAFAK